MNLETIYDMYEHFSKPSNLGKHLTEKDEFREWLRLSKDPVVIEKTLRAFEEDGAFEYYQEIVNYLNELNHRKQ